MRKTKLGWVAALMSAVAMEAPLAGQTLPSAEPSTANDETRSELTKVPLPQTQFLDMDGNPLPSDIGSDLEKQLPTAPPPVESSGAVEPAAPATAAPAAASNGDIIVSGHRPRGSVVGTIAPERTFDPLDIDAYGVSNVRELIQALGPQVGSSRGGADRNPVTLLNGRRVSSFNEIAEIPTEAIERMEVFPEELALKYGYRADQKVVNIITFEKFNSRLGQLASSSATEGGYDTVSAQANYFAIRQDTRFDFSADYSRATALPEGDRNLAQPDGTPDAGRFRTLLPETERLAMNGLISGNLLDDVSSTLNGRYEINSSKSLLGLALDDPLMQDTETRIAHLGTSQGGLRGKWQWSLTGNYDRTSTKTLTDTNVALAARDEARAVDSLANADLVANGTLLKLPAGPVTTSLRGGVETRDFSSSSLRSGVGQRTALSRDKGVIQASFDVPITSRRQKGLDWLGTVSANANLAIEQLSDFGMLRTFGYGLNWSAINAINVTVSTANEQRAPSVEQLGAPSIVTPNVRTFDFTRREVVDVTRVFGGNANLRSEDRHVFRMGLNAKPFSKTDITLSIEYQRMRTDDPIAAFPIVTPEIEAAFPGRFTRDVDGRLMQIDSTPLNFERSDQAQMRWGISFVRPLGALEPWMRSAPVRSYASESDARAAAKPGTMVAMVQPGSAMARRFENLTSRLYFNLFHTWQLQDDLVVREDLPRLDLLDGSAIDLLGGTRRHRLECQAGVFKKGLGARVTANWRSGTSVRNLGAAAGDLTFSDLTTVNFTLFANLGDRFGGGDAPKWFKGTRATFGITNLFNERQQVRSQTGSPPLTYQPAYLDPIGRFISFGLRTVF